MQLLHARHDLSVKALLDHHRRYDNPAVAPAQYLPLLVSNDRRGGRAAAQTMDGTAATFAPRSPHSMVRTRLPARRVIPSM
jgi:hypothetical protein